MNASILLVSGVIGFAAAVLLATALALFGAKLYREQPQVLIIMGVAGLVLALAIGSLGLPHPTY